MVLKNAEKPLPVVAAQNRYSVVTATYLAARLRSLLLKHHDIALVDLRHNVRQLHRERLAIL